MSVKFSAIAAAGAVAGANTILGVQGGTTDVQYTVTNLATFFWASPTLVTPTLGVAVGTSLALGGATIGSNALAWTGSAVGSDTLTITQATANHSILASTGYSLTGSSTVAMMDLAGTWNTSGVPTAIKLNMTNTASGTGSLLLDLQRGGTSVFAAGWYPGQPTIPTLWMANAAPTTTNWILGNNSNGIQVNANSGGTVSLAINTNNSLSASGTVIGLQSAVQFGFVASGSPPAALDTILTRAAAATWQHGAADAASPVAQTIQAQSVVAGTTATAGVDFTFVGSKPTGASAGGAIVFKTAPAGGSGTAQTAAAEVLRLLAAGNVKFTNVANFSANGAVLTSLTGVGPTGAQTTVQEWLTIQNASGTTRYIPCF